MNNLTAEMQDIYLQGAKKGIEKGVDMLEIALENCMEYTNKNYVSPDDIDKCVKALKDILANDKELIDDIAKGV